MKLLNKALCLVALCAIGSIVAKKSGAGAAATRPGYTGGNEPYTGGGETKGQYSSLNEFVDLKRRRPEVAVMPRNDRVIFTDSFLLSTQAFVKGSGLDANVFKFLLKLGRDKNFNFTGNDTTDLAILEDSNKLITFLADNFGTISYDMYLKYLTANKFPK